MVRKTVSIDEELFERLREEGLMDSYRNFSELVSDALHRRLEAYRRRSYQEAIEAMRADPMVREDIAEIEEAFRFSDRDGDAV